MVSEHDAPLSHSGNHRELIGKLREWRAGSEPVYDEEGPTGEVHDVPKDFKTMQIEREQAADLIERLTQPAGSHKELLERAQRHLNVGRRLAIPKTPADGLIDDLCSALTATEAAKDRMQAWLERFQGVAAEKELARLAAEAEAARYRAVVEAARGVLDDIFQTAYGNDERIAGMAERALASLDNPAPSEPYKAPQHVHDEACAWGACPAPSTEGAGE